MTLPPQILLAEDEPLLAQALSAYLKQDGYQVCVVDDGAEVIPTFERVKPGMLLLDIMLPNIDGMVLCREIRKVSQLPILMLTARVDEVDRLLGLELGADDYICKPYSPREVLARIRAVWRRYEIYQENSSGSDNTSPTEEVVLDEKTLTVHWQGKSVELTLVEFRLLQTLQGEPRRVFNRQQLMNRIYNDSRIVSDRTIDSHITKLRRKLQDVGLSQDIIRSVYGAGYKINLPI